MQTNYLAYIDRVVRTGRVRESRYGPTYEVSNSVFHSTAGWFPERPRLNPKIGVVEGLFLVTGTYDLEVIKRVAPNANHALFTERGAYGPRVGYQVTRLVDALATDPTSRQHVVHVSDQSDPYREDTPCTVALHFLAYNGFLDVTAMMRSSDAIKGLPTDVIQFGVLLTVVARCVDLYPGQVHVFAASSHVYASDLDRRPTGDRIGSVWFPHLPRGMSPGGRLDYARNRAHDAMFHDDEWTSTDPEYTGLRLTRRREDPGASWPPHRRTGDQVVQGGG